MNVGCLHCVNPAWCSSERGPWCLALSHLFPPLPLLLSRDSPAHMQTSQLAQTNSVSLPSPPQPSTHLKADPWPSLSLRARHTSVPPVLSGWICKRDSPTLEAG